MFRTINPLAATLLVVGGTAFGFTAHAALPDESAPTRQVDLIEDDPTPVTPGPSVHRLHPCVGDICPQ